MSATDASCTVCSCGCTDAAGAAVHAVVVALACDDLDTAIERGLLSDTHCAQCTPACRTLLTQARAARRNALAARERYNVRNARLQQRAQERARQRNAAAPATPDESTTAAPPALPSAAAAALARARAKAAQRHKP